MLSKNRSNATARSRFTWLRHTGTAAIFVLVLSLVLAACGAGEEGVGPVTGPTEGLVEEPLIEGTEEPLADATPLAEGTEEPLIEGTEEPLADATPLAEGTEEPAEDMTAAPTETGDAMEETMGEEVSLSDIADDPEAYIGQTVTVTGEVSTVIDQQAFRMNEGNLLDIGDELLVLQAGDQVTTNLAEDARVQVTGTVRNFVQTEVEDEFGFDLDDETYTEYENRTAIIADSVNLAATVSEIDDNPEAYIASTVTVRGDVTEVIGARVFRLNDPGLLGGDDLVVLTDEDISVAEGDSVEVTGTVNRFDAATIERAATDVANLEELTDQLADSLLLVAQTVQPVQQ